jgi:diacylglycerol kinase family enzyme
MRHFFIIDPNSFTTQDNLKKVLTDIEKCFAARRDEEHKTYFSRYPRDAIAVIHRYMDAVPSKETVRVYAIGGNGILFDCLNGTVDYSNTELTVIPYGSANDFVRVFGEDAEKKFQNIQNLVSAVSRPMDIIDCGSNYALNNVACGVESQAVIITNDILRRSNSKWLRKHITGVYSYGAVKAAFNKDLRKQNYQVFLDGEDVSGRYCNISVTNTPCIGGTMVSNPHAKPDDGFLNVIFTSDVSLPTFLGAMGAYTSGCFEKHDTVFKHREFKSMEIRSDEPMHVNLDHVTFYSYELKIRVVPGGIRFAVPADMELADYSYKAYKPKAKRREAQ